MAPLHGIKGIKIIEFTIFPIINKEKGKSYKFPPHTHVKNRVEWGIGGICAKYPMKLYTIMYKRINNRLNPRKFLNSDQAENSFNRYAGKFSLFFFV